MTVRWLLTGREDCLVPGGSNDFFGGGASQGAPTDGEDDPATKVLALQGGEARLNVSRSLTVLRVFRS